MSRASIPSAEHVVDELQRSRLAYEDRGGHLRIEDGAAQREDGQRVRNRDDLGFVFGHDADASGNRCCNEGARLSR
jgi:hypothetical protein